jgi:Fe-S cluster assembly protein SufB
MAKENQLLEEITGSEYKYGFSSDIATDTAPKGLDETTVRFISKKKNEPEWMLELRLKAFRYWLTLEEPRHWAHIKYPEIDFQDIIYYAAPKKNKELKSLDEVDPELLRTFEKLGISLEEQKRISGVQSNIAVDAVIDSVSVKTTFKETLAEKGIIFCSFSEAVQEHPELIKQYMGSVVPYTDNYYAALNAAVFSDGSFCYIPKGVRCPMELSTYFRINTSGTGQFERTLIIADEGAYVSYLEGCTAPMRDENQLHAAVVEIIAHKNGEVKYSTVQNWYPGDKNGKGGIYNFVTKRGICLGDNSKISWTQVETGSAITWKYPSVILKGNNSVGEFYSVAVTNNHQQADTGTKMTHLGKNTRSTIVSKGISAGFSNNSYRGLVRIAKGAHGARNHSQCDSLLMGDKCGAHTFPYIEIKDKSAIVEHEATTSKIGEDQIFYCNQRGIETEKAVALIVNGYCKEVLNQLPMEFAVEAQKLLAVSLEGSVG